MDMTESIAPKSDQLNADDLMAGPVTVTVREVAAGTPEQPVYVHLIEFPGRAYRPSKSMRRVMVLAWGAEAATYAGHRITLFRNPEITFGRDKVGGIEIAALSHIDKALTVALTATRGKRKNFTVQPLAEAVPKVVRDWQSEMDAVTDTTTLTALYKAMTATPGAFTEELKLAFGVRGAAIKHGEIVEEELI
ncbi:hypothetical protein E3T54_02825 [Cryobacterium sp. Sr8]|uniref:hypothetical protein n=1 Tax=Cryobacterium sp. Sr8 TaxID=1259203 RepID=UPI00106C9F66|nr:hypothetical protein [Cryobacterium sp. Sr8]TFD80692.1 hypothetical protein E3T54_02825 [Cryobacterium sp. Sr8]